MITSKAQQVRAILAWVLLVVILIAPIVIAAMSPLLQWRDPIYIAAGFAGIFGLVLLLVQPLLAGGHLPGFGMRASRRLHQYIGVCLVLAVIVHVVGLWITSPPDVVDVLLFRSPTPFSIWGVVAMWAVFAAAFLAVIRQSLRPVLWRLAHTSLAVIIVIGTVVHALLIEGTMGTVSKGVLSALAVVATAKVILDLRVWALLLRRRT